MIHVGPRLALRRLLKMVVILGASVALALSGLSIESASASTRSRLALSASPDRSSAVRLDGSTAKGKIYVFVKNSESLDKVDFYLDGRSRTKPPVQTDTNPPFDFAGTAADGTALPYDTTKLADGSHTIRAVLTWSNGTRSSRRGTSRSLTAAQQRAHRLADGNMPLRQHHHAPTATNTASPTAPYYHSASHHHFGPDNGDHRNVNDNSDRERLRRQRQRPRPRVRLPRPASTPTPSPNTPTITDAFETGDFKRWNLCQWNAGGSIRNDNCETYSGTGEYAATVVNESAAHPKSARFELRNGDIPFGSTERAEIARPDDGSGYVVEGDERWISFDLKFDSRWPVPDARSSWTIFFQWHGSGSTSSPPLALDIDTDDVIYLVNNDSSGYQRTPVQSVVRNQWQRWVIHAKFSDDDAVGFAEVTIDVFLYCLARAWPR